MTRRLLALAMGAACLLPAMADAASLRVSPVLFEMAPARPAATLTLHNEGDTPLTVQMRVFHWSNGPDGDVLTPATEVVASPPFSTVAAGAEQTVRLVRTDGKPLEGEQAFRVLVDELPAPDKADGTTVTLLMRHSIPVFVEGTASKQANVTWSVTADKDGFRLTAVNHGQRRQRIADMHVTDASGQVIAERDGLLGYVLANSTVEWRLPRKTGTAGAAVKLALETDLGHQDVSVSPAAP